MRRLLLATAACLGLALPLAGPALAACPDDAEVAMHATNLLAGRNSAPYPALTTLEDGFCAQAKLVAILSQHWGRPVGYKLGLTSEPVQRLFGVPHPVRGTIFANTLRLRSGAEVPANFGATSQVEADFLVRVRSARINQAGRDHLAILRELDQVVPYIELPDLGLTGGVTGPQLLAVNVGARMGVLGRPIPVQATQAFADALASMTVTTTDDTGRQIATAPGRAVLGHPLNAVAFLIEDLAKQGKRLEAGQMLSIAGYSPPTNVAAGRTYTVTYAGLLAEPVSVSVRIR